jgi:hypothetical protein
MPRLPALLLLGTLAAAPLGAQLHLGLVAGGASTTLGTATATQIPNKSAQRGFLAGISASARLTDQLSFGPEVYYIRKGANAEDNTHVVKEEIRISYVEVPLLLRYTVGSGSLRPYLLGGGAVSFLASCRLRFAGLGQDIREDCKANNAEATSTDVGAIFGAGVAFGRVGVSVRYNIGLKNIKKASVGGDEIKNRALLAVVSVGM